MKASWKHLRITARIEGAVKKKKGQSWSFSLKVWWEVENNNRKMWNYGPWADRKPTEDQNSPFTHEETAAQSPEITLSIVSFPWAPQGKGKEGRGSDYLSLGFECQVWNILTQREKENIRKHRKSRTVWPALTRRHDSLGVFTYFPNFSSDGGERREGKEAARCPATHRMVLLSCVCYFLKR